MLERFKEITGHDLQGFLQRFNTFVNTKYNSIVSYYNGNGNIDNSAFTELDKLITESEFISNLFGSNYSNFSYDISWWNILDTFEDVQERLITIKNSPKWFRASYVNSFDSNTDMDYITRENETLEDTARNLEYDDPQNDWVDISVKNNILEGDYDKDGGALLRVTFSNNRNINITSVVDVMDGINALGKDIDRNIVFVSDDLKTLDPSNTVTQSIKIKLEIKKGSMPEFPEVGLSIIEGSSYNFLRYPIIFRQLSQIFRLDDTFKSIEIIDIRKDQDAVFIDINIRSKIEEVQELQSLSI